MIKSGNDVLVQVKDNQSGVLAGCRAVAAREMPVDTYTSPQETGRNRIETRTCRVFKPRYVFDKEWGDMITEIIEVRRVCERKNTKSKTWERSEETAYFICTTKKCASRYNRIIRDHWGIENRNHYVRDVTLGEDASRIRVNPEIMARLRSVALNVFRANYIENIAQKAFQLLLEPIDLKEFKFLI